MRVKVVGCAVQHGERAEKFDHSVEFSAVVRRCTRPSGRVRIETYDHTLFQHLVKVFHAFQSSPVPEDGCNRMTLIQEIKEERVSILTRPGGRVQRRTTALNSTQLSSFSAKQRR